MKLNFYAFHYVVCLFLMQMLAVSAQTPKLQLESIWATNIKVDGNIAEWKGPLKGYDKKTKIAYTLANDDKNIYLAIKTLSTSKAISGGISIEINQCEVTFPYNPSRDRIKYYADPNAYRKKILKIPEDFKQIEVSGFKEIKKPIISIYNEYGIKALITEDKEKYYTYELAIPLALLRLNINSQSSFDYKIKLKGIIIGPGIQGSIVHKEGRSRKLERELEEASMDLSTPTQFTGKYKLASAPVQN